MKHNLIRNSVILLLNLLLFQTSFAIYIKHQPQNVSINYCGGLEQVSFTTIAREGVGTFQWQEDNGLGFEDITNANDSILNIDVTSLGQDGLKFRCIVTSECSNNISDTSDVAYLFVSSIPPPPSVNVTSLLGFGESTLLVDTSFVLVESACENSNSFIYVFSDLPIYNNYKFQIDNLDGNGFVDYNQITYNTSYFAGQFYDSALTVYQLPQLTSELLTLNNKKLRFATIGGCNNDVFDYSNDITFQVEFTATTGKISLTTYDANGLEHISFDTNSCNLSYPLELFNDIDTCNAIKTLIANCPSNNCDFKLYMYDSNNDGWNGNTMSLLINGNVVQSNISLSSGGIDSLLFPVLNGDEISIIWNGGGFNEEETSYEMFDQNQNIIGIGSQSNIGDGNYFTKWAIKNHNSNSWTNLEEINYINPQNAFSYLLTYNEGLNSPSFWPDISGNVMYNNLFDSLATIRCIVYNGVIQSSDTSFIDVEIKTGDQTLTYGTIDQNVNNQYINHTVDVIGCNFPYDFTMVPNSIQIDVDGVPQNVTPNSYSYELSNTNPMPVQWNYNLTNDGFTINSMDYNSFLNGYPFWDDQSVEMSIDSIFINGYCPIKLNQPEIIEIAKLDIVQELKIEELDSINLSNSIICSGDTLTILVNLDSENDNFIEYFLSPDSVRWMVDQGTGIFTPISTDYINYIGSTTLELSIISSTNKHNNIYKCVVYEKDCNLFDEIHSNSFVFKNSNKTKIPTIQITESGSRCIGGQLTLSANPSSYTNYNWWIDSLDGNGFVILNDNNIFTGTNSSDLIINISNEMYNWTKWRFACQVDTSLYCNSFSEIYKLEVYPNYVNTNINEITNNNLELNYFPNPVVSNLNIESFDKIKEISIYSLDGILVSKINSKNYIETINFSKFDSGIYSIKVNSESGKTKRFKIINL